MRILPSVAKCWVCKANIEYTVSDLQGYESKYFVCPVCGAVVYPGRTGA